MVPSIPKFRNKGSRESERLGVEERSVYPRSCPGPLTSFTSIPVCKEINCLFLGLSLFLHDVQCVGSCSGGRWDPVIYGTVDDSSQRRRSLGPSDLVGNFDLTGVPPLESLWSGRYYPRWGGETRWGSQYRESGRQRRKGVGVSGGGGEGSPSIRPYPGPRR